MQRFFVPVRLTGANEYIDACRRNPHKANNMKKTDEYFIQTAARKYGIRPAKPPVVIRYLWVETDRRRDCDNIAFAKKFVQDALVRMGILPGDGQKTILGFTDDFKVDKKLPGVWIEIEEVGA